MSLSDTDLKLLSSIKRHLRALKPQLPSRAVITVGQYTLGLLSGSSSFTVGDADLIRVHHKKDLEYKTMPLEPDYTLEIDTAYEPHYWFDVQGQIERRGFRRRIEKYLYRYHRDVFTLTNLGEGTASGVLPILHAFLKEEEKNSLGVTIFPSMNHSSDALFNAFSCAGIICQENTTPLLFIDQGNLEKFRGVHRKGESLNGVEVVEYIMEILLEKEGFLHDFYTLTSNFNIQNFMPLIATGCSLDIYEDLRNILDITLEQPLMNVDLSTSSIVYVIVRAPAFYRDVYTKGYIEYEVSQWLTDSLGVDIPQICDVIFRDEYGDRVDVLMLVGGFDTRPLFQDVYSRIRRFSNLNVEQKLIDGELWDRIKKKLLEN